MDAYSLQKNLQTVLQVALETGGETVNSNGYRIQVKIDSAQGEGYIDWIPILPTSYTIDKNFNSKLWATLSSVLYPFFTLYPSGPTFVSTESDDFCDARALRFFFKVGTYSRMHVSDINTSYISDGHLSLMEGYEYDFEHNAGHVAISGSSGTGKSVFAEYLLGQFWLTGAKIVIVDPKLDYHLYHFSQKRHIEYHYPKVGANQNAFNAEVATVLSKAINVIGERQATVLNGQEQSFRPYIVFVDEAAAFSTKELRNLMEQIVLMGRACRVWLFISAQTMDATTVISSTARDSMGLRIVLSANPTVEDCRYLLKGFDPADIAIPSDGFRFGSGLIEQKSDGRVVPFLAPYIENLE